MKRWITVAVYMMTALIGILAFLYPFFQPLLLSAEAATASRSETGLLTALLLLLCLLVLMLELQGRTLGVKTIATLGVLVAIAAVLRFIEVAVPLPGGFSPIFAPIIIAGYIFGSRFGLLMGTLTLFVSALITGGVGPWLPYQMFVAGWVGASAGWLPRRRLGIGTPAVLALAIFGFMWGLLFGLLINLYIWPFLAIEADMAWQNGITVGTAVARYLVFYVATSLVWDVVRAVGNAVLIAVLGAATLRALARFHDRIIFVRLDQSTLTTSEVGR